MIHTAAAANPVRCAMAAGSLVLAALAFVHPASGDIARAALSADAAWVVATAAVIFCAALVSSIAGFAFSAIASAALLRLLDDPVRAVAVMVACSIAIQLYSVWALRRLIEWRRVAPFLAGGAFTVPVGVWLLTRSDPYLFCLGLGLFLVIYGLYMLYRPSSLSIRTGWRVDVAVGALGGLAGGVAAFPGSFVAAWCGLRGWSKEMQRAVTQPYILIMQVEALALLHTRAPSAIDSATFFIYVPVALAAAYLGVEVFRRMTTRQFSLTVNALLVVSGAALLGPALFF